MERESLDREALDRVSLDRVSLDRILPKGEPLRDDLLGTVLWRDGLLSW
jgi:hypothetical protein